MNLLARPFSVGAALAALMSAALVFGSGCFNVDPPTGTLDECVKSGGVCLPEGQCVPSGGKVSTGCFFGDGNAECCMPPAKVAGDDSCPGQGGLCTVGIDCINGKGYFTVKSADCGTQGEIRACCVPYNTCGDPNFDCCSNVGAKYPAACDEGKVVCTQGTQKPVGSCQLP